MRAVLCFLLSLESRRYVDLWIEGNGHENFALTPPSAYLLSSLVFHPLIHRLWHGSVATLYAKGCQLWIAGWTLLISSSLTYEHTKAHVKRLVETFLIPSEIVTSCVVNLTIPSFQLPLQIEYTYIQRLSTRLFCTLK